MAFENASNSTKASTSSLTLPKKGILKRSCSHSGVTNELADRRSRLPLQLFRPTSTEKVQRIPKLSLTWSENNAVAIFGDTTSEETLDEPDDNKPSTSKLIKTHSQPLQLSTSFERLRQIRSFHNNEKNVEESNIHDPVHNRRTNNSSRSLQAGLNSSCQNRRSSSSSEAEKLHFNSDLTKRQLEDKPKAEWKTSKISKEVQSKSLCAGEPKTGLISNITVSEKLPYSKRDEESNETVRLFLELEARKNKADSFLEKEEVTGVALCGDPGKLPSVSPSASHSEVEHPVAAYTMHHDVLLQLQAYQNEIAIWRMKAAHLQTLLKGSLQKPHQSQKASSSECLKSPKHEKQKRASVDEAEVKNRYQTLPTGSSLIIASSSECISSNCLHAKELLRNENDKLKNEIEKKKYHVNSLEEKVRNLEAELSVCRCDKSQSLKTIQKMRKESEQSKTEVQAANLTIIRLQDELTTKKKAMEYLEERSQAYRNIILDNDLTVPDESMTDWRRGFLDPRFVANPSKKVQTQLTFQDLQHNEAHLHDLKDRFKVLKEEHNTNESNWREKVREVEENLSAKNSLVDLLTNELEKKEKDIAELVARQRKVQEALEMKIAELTKIADRVPTLQLELDRLQQEKSLMHLKLQDVQEEFDAGLENSLTASLMKYQEQSVYWAEKLDVANKANEVLRAKIIDMQREQEEMRLRMKVEKADISQRLTSSIQKVDHLRSQINRSTHEVEVEAHPHCNNKYVACKPHTKNKSTSIRKGELFDELEERLKLCKGELTATRRQVEVLQQKLVDTIQTQAQDQNSSLQLKKTTHLMRKDKATEVNSYLDTIQEIDSLREKVDQLEQQNFSLTSALSKLEDEKWHLTVSKHEHMTELAAEFEGEMAKYEDERCRLIDRIRVLRKANLERDSMIRCLKDYKINMKLGAIEFSTMNRSLSVSCLERKGIVEELEASKACNLVLRQINTELSKELFSVKDLIERHMQIKLQKLLKFTQKPVTNSLSGDFVQSLRTELNQVEKVMENAVYTIDNNVFAREALKFNGTNHQSSIVANTDDKDEEVIWNDLICLRKALKRSWKDRKSLSKQLDRIAARFRDFRIDRQKILLQQNFDYKQQLPVIRSRSFGGYTKWSEDQGPSETARFDDETESLCSLTEGIFCNKQSKKCFISATDLTRSTSWSSSLNLLLKISSNENY